MDYLLFSMLIYYPQYLVSFSSYTRRRFFSKFLNQIPWQTLEVARYLGAVWLHFFITQFPSLKFYHSSLITHHSSLITQFFTPIWHHHLISITQYFSHYLWAHTCQPVQFFFFFWLFLLLFSVPKLTKAIKKLKKKK